LVLGPAAAAIAADSAFVKTTFPYKVVGPTRILADVYRADDAKVRPVLVWIHGGALILGSRSSVPQDLLDLCRNEGFILVSLDYRLAPETKLPAIIADLEDAFRWLRERGPALFHADPNRVVVAGGSAGGYLTLMAGCRVRPRPRALVAYWGYGDMDGDWYTKPSEYYRGQAPLVTREQAYRAVGEGVPTGAEGQGRRGRFYLYLRQNGLWTRAVTGFDPASDRTQLDAYCPVRSLPVDFPPVLLIHGTADKDVPYELSAAMDRELTRRRLSHELITVPGAGHGLAGGDPQRVAQAHRRARDFIREHLK
jgi:acetyl esterase/lipase